MGQDARVDMSAFVDPVEGLKLQESYRTEQCRYGCVRGGA